MTNRPAKIEDVQNPAPTDISHILATGFGSVYRAGAIMCGYVNYEYLPDGSVEWQTLKILGTQAEHCTSEVEWAGKAAGELKVFVHGYNNSFEDALRRGITLGQGSLPVIVWSWPSAGAVTDYSGDFRRSTDSRTIFREVLGGAGARGGFVINMVGHSMGSHLVEDTSRFFQSMRSNQAVLSRLVFAAPNINPQKLLEVASSSVGGTRIMSVLYACKNDWVLKHLSPREYRAGLGGDDIVLHPGLESIDVECRSGGPEYSHSYFFSEIAVRKDYNGLMLGRPPGQRDLAVLTRGNIRYWLLKP